MSLNLDRSSGLGWNSRRTTLYRDARILGLFCPGWHPKHAENSPKVEYVRPFSAKRPPIRKLLVSDRRRALQLSRRVLHFLGPAAAESNATVVNVHKDCVFNNG